MTSKLLLGVQKGHGNVEFLLYAERQHKETHVCSFLAHVCSFLATGFISVVSTSFFVAVKAMMLEKSLKLQERIMRTAAGPFTTLDLLRQ
mmetsp:Transcript_23627/g.49434  ORF Transcript_23627/g.49434 Transcript_23627/m.49434 type:complete len:90 (-) Transcript_23627:189-458(-)